MEEDPLRFILVDYFPTAASWGLSLLLWLGFKANEERQWARMLSIALLLTGIGFILFPQYWQGVLAHWQDRGRH